MEELRDDYRAVSRETQVWVALAGFHKWKVEDGKRDKFNGHVTWTGVDDAYLHEKPRVGLAPLVRHDCGGR